MLHAGLYTLSAMRSPARLQSGVTRDRLFSNREPSARMTRENMGYAPGLSVCSATDHIALRAADTAGIPTPQYAALTRRDCRHMPLSQETQITFSRCAGGKADMPGRLLLPIGKDGRSETP